MKYLFLILLIVGCNNHSVEPKKENKEPTNHVVDDTGLMTVTVKEVCLNGTVYYYGFIGAGYQGGPMLTPKIDFKNSDKSCQHHYVKCGE